MPVKNKLYGIDISHHNKYNLPKFSMFDFIIMKATEGISFVDPCLKQYISMLKKDQLYGFYHYARPERNRAKEEAKNFINTIGIDGENAMLFEVENIDECAQTLHRMLTDSSLRKKMGESSKHVYEVKFQLSNNVNKLIEYYNLK